MLNMHTSYIIKKTHEIWHSKKKGEVNYFLAIAIGTVILMVIGWPQLSSIATSLWNAVSTWFTTNTSKVFTNLP